MLYTRQKRYGEAVEMLQKAIAIKPTFANAHAGLGIAYAEMGLLDKAEAEYRTAIGLSPLYPEARRRLGRLLLDLGRLAEAEEQYRRAVEVDPTAEGYDRLGDIYLRWVSAARAEQAFARAAALDPFDSYAHFHLGALYAARGRFAEAVREYEAGLLTDPRNPQALAALRQLKAGAGAAASPQP